VCLGRNDGRERGSLSGAVLKRVSNRGFDRGIHVIRENHSNDRREKIRPCFRFTRHASARIVFSVTKVERIHNRGKDSVAC
jgi:hypothetical protein